MTPLLVRTTVLTLLVFAAVLVTGSRAAEAIIIGCGADLGPGNYKLYQDLDDCTGEWAIRVTGPATLNLNKKTISCDLGDTLSFTDPDGVVLTGGPVTLKKGTITRCDNAVSLEGDGRHKVELILAQNNVKGFRVGSDNNVLTLNKALQNEEDGFYIAIGADNNHLKLNWASENGDDGFGLEESTGNVLMLNAAKRNGDSGISLEEGSTNNEVKLNLALDNAQNQEGTEGEPELDELDFDLADESEECDSNTWRLNKYGTKNQTCIH